MLGAVHIRWKQLRRDLHHPSDESRQELLVFIRAELKVEIDSLSELSNPQLARLLDALAREERRGGKGEEGNRGKGNVVRFPGQRQENGRPNTEDGETGSIEHLASAEQNWAIENLFVYLGWITEGKAAFIDSKFGRRNAAH